MKSGQRVSALKNSKLLECTELKCAAGADELMLGFQAAARVGWPWHTMLKNVISVSLGQKLIRISSGVLVCVV